MFYFVPAPYQPNVAQAAINRCKAYLRGFSELGTMTTVICYGEDKKYAEIQLPHINYSCFRTPFTNKWLSYIPKSFFVIWLLLKLKKDDVILFYGSDWLWFQIIKWKKNVKIYVERTEKPEIVGLGGKFLTPTYKAYYKACAKLDGMFVISTALKEWFVSKGVDKSRIRIINVIVDPKRFEGLEKQHDQRYVAYCGTASNNKDGVDLLIKSFALISSKHPDVYLYIIGRTPDKTQSFENAKLVRDLGIEEKVVFTGSVNMEKMPQILFNAEICALARPNNEQARYGFATKMGEYLLSGRPVVLTKVGDFPLFLKDGVSALLADPDSINSFACKLDWALSNVEEAEKIGLQGKEVAYKSFNYLIETKKILNAIIQYG